MFCTHHLHKIIFGHIHMLNESVYMFSDFCTVKCLFVICYTLVVFWLLMMLLPEIPIKLTTQHNQLALRVTPSVTRLTVYRWLHIPALGARSSRPEYKKTYGERTVKLEIARRIGFREQYYTGTRDHYCAGKIGVSNPMKLCVGFGMFFFLITLD